jgi:signal transduction histidine kinase
MQLQASDGRHIPVEVHCQPLQSLGCSSTPIILAIREVVREPVQDQRNVGLSLLARLAGVLAHEIRNPMNAIFLHADIVEEEVRQPMLGDRPQVAQSLATIKGELMRLHGLMQDYLFLARLSSLQREAIDLGALVEEVVYDLHPQCAFQGVSLTLNGPEDLGEVALHQSAFRRALHSLLQLLLEALPRGATLSLSGVRTSCHVQLCIHDPNQAISPQTWEGLQATLWAKTPEPAELRTYVAQAIVSAHGGEIGLSANAQAGLMCVITIPLDTVR